MRVYLGQTRSAKLIARLTELGFGECTQRGDLPPRRRPWMYDNRAYEDWQHGRPFNADRFERDIERIVRDQLAPDFIVLPDLVTQGVRSLEFSTAWLPNLKGIAPLYLAVQDGMTYRHVGPLLRDLDGLFVGGSPRWKIRHGHEWAAYAHRHRLPCHIGRCGGYVKTLWAKRIEADSIDSCLPLRSQENLARFLEALGESRQLDLATWAHVANEMTQATMPMWVVG